MRNTSLFVYKRYMEIHSFLMSKTLSWLKSWRPKEKKSFSVCDLSHINLTDITAGWRVFFSHKICEKKNVFRENKFIDPKDRMVVISHEWYKCGRKWKRRWADTEDQAVHSNTYYSYKVRQIKQDLKVTRRQSGQVSWMKERDWK